MQTAVTYLATRLRPNTPSVLISSTHNARRMSVGKPGNRRPPQDRYPRKIAHPGPRFKKLKTQAAGIVVEPQLRDDLLVDTVLDKRKGKEKESAEVRGGNFVLPNSKGQPSTSAQARQFAGGWQEGSPARASSTTRQGSSRTTTLEAVNTPMLYPDTEILVPELHPPDSLRQGDTIVASELSLTKNDFEVAEDSWKRSPLPLAPPNPHPLDSGISGAAAALAYLRRKGSADRDENTTFYLLLVWILRHAARDLGYDIVPDGFVRLSDLLRFELFQRYSVQEFAQRCVDDRFDRFEVVELPEVSGKDIWWVRSRQDHTIPGVLSSIKRVINMGKLQTVVHRAPIDDWPDIQKNGICEGPDRTIRLYQKGSTFVFNNIIPRQAKYICITIDAQRAADLGVMFFHTQEVDLLAVGRNGVIPTEAIRSVVELELTKTKLPWT